MARMASSAACMHAIVFAVLLLAVPVPSRYVVGSGNSDDVDDDDDGARQGDRVRVGDGEGSVGTHGSVVKWGVDAGTAVPLIAPVEGSAMLAVTKEGAELLRSGMGGSASNPDPLVAPVVVIVRRK